MFHANIYFEDQKAKSFESYLESLKGYLYQKLDDESAVNSIYINRKKVTIEVDRKRRKSLYEKVVQLASGFIPGGEFGYYAPDDINVRGVRL